MGDAILGSCHCGELRWSFIGRPESATACNCTICRRYGALWAHDVEEGRIHVAGTGGEYIRGEGAIGFISARPAAASAGGAGASPGPTAAAGSR